MHTVFILVNLFIVPFAIAAPWATIEAFSAGRATGWLMTLASVISHTYVWYIMAQSSEALFCFGALWAAYEFVCLSFAPLGVIEVEEEQAAATAADKG